MYYVEVNGRGVKSDLIAREIVDTIATAALKENMVAISYMAYGDDPVRIGIPMKTFVAFSTNWENMEGEVARYNPDNVQVSFILDPTLSKGIERWANAGRRSVFEKISPDALVIVNTKMTPEEYLDLLPEADVDYSLITIDCGDTERPSVLPLLGAFAAKHPIISEKTLGKILGEKYQNIDPFVNAASMLKTMKVRKGEGGAPPFSLPPRLPTVSEMPVGVVIPAVPKKGRNPNYKTSSSRTYKPIINYDICIRCKTCWILCPDGAIDKNGNDYPSINYDYCTGCLICESQCPVQAIESNIEYEREA